MGVIVRIVVLLSFLIFAGWIVGGLYLDAVVRSAVETVGPKVTGTAVSLDHVNISFVLGRGRLTGLVIANPEGFHTPDAFRLRETTVTFDPLSVFSGKLVVDELVVHSPSITYELTLSGNNLDKIRANARAFARAHGMASVEQRSEDIDAGLRGIQINRVHVKDPRLNVSASLFRGRSLTFHLDDIHLRDIGRNTEGVTVLTAASQVLTGITKPVFRTVSRTGQVLVRDHGQRDRRHNDSQQADAWKSWSGFLAKLWDRLKGLVAGGE